MNDIFEEVFMNWILLGVGSLVGGYARYALTGGVHRLTGFSFPYGTLVVNFSGCFLIGLLNALAENKLALGAQGRIFLMTGFCGAFTTFSTFILESMNLIKAGEWFQAGANLGGSVFLGILAFITAEMLIKSI